MTNQDLTKKMLNKKFFKQVTGAGKGLLGLIDPSYKRYKASHDQQLVSQVLLRYYKPILEGTDEGFGEYGVFASVLNEEGKEELGNIKRELQEDGLIDDISNIRYESQNAYGCCLIDGLNEGASKDGERLIRQYSSDNLYLYVLANNRGDKLRYLDKAVVCKHPKFGRTVYSINN